MASARRGAGVLMSDALAMVPRALDEAAVSRALNKLVRPGAVVPLTQLREAYVRAVLRSHGGNKTAAAKALGVTRFSLYRWLEGDR